MAFSRLLFYFFLISIQLGVRILAYQFTPGFHEYEIAWLYTSDLFLLLFLFSFFSRNKLRNKLDTRNSGSPLQFRFPIVSYLSLIVFLFFAAVSIFFAASEGLAIYNFFRLLLLALTALAVANLIRDKKVFKTALMIIAILAITQSLIGFGQFINQKNLGLKFLGESPISASDGASSKIVVEGAKVLRAYGTFPHPNILAAFLVLGLLALYYFWLKRPSEWKIFSSVKNLLSDLLIGAAIFTAVFGLMITFSRAAWGMAVFATTFIIIFSLIKKDRFIQAVRLLVLMSAIGLILFFSFQALILPRTKISADEPAVTERASYNKLAIGLIKSHPFGVGIGNQVLFSAREGVYRNFGFENVWQWQPIHNIYLLIASETGVIGLLVFLAFLISLFLNPNLFKVSSLEFRISAIMLLALLLLGLYDHFLWTIWQGQLILWLSIGIIIGVKEQTS